MGIRSTASDYLDRSTGYALGTSFSFCCWVWVDYVDDLIYPVNVAESSSYVDYIAIAQRSSDSRFALECEGSGITVSSAAPTGEWVFYAGSHQSSPSHDYSLYRWRMSDADGSPETGNTANSEFAVASPAYFSIGDPNAEEIFFVANVKVWNGVVLSETEFARERHAVMPVRWANIHACYPLAADFKDYSGNGLDLSETGTVTFAKAGPEIPWAQPATLAQVNQRPAIEFGATLDESYDWTFIATQTAVPDSVVIYLVSASTSGTVVFSASVEAVGDGDSTDLDVAESFDGPNFSAPAIVPSTAGRLMKVRVALNNDDSVAAGDEVRIRLTRHASIDTASSTASVLAVEVCG